MSRDVSALNVVLERFASVADVSLGHSSKSTHAAIVSQRRGKSRERRWSRWPLDQRDRDQLDHGWPREIWKRCCDSPLCRGSVSHGIPIIQNNLTVDFLGKGFNSIYGRDWNWYSGELMSLSILGIREKYLQYRKYTWSQLTSCTSIQSRKLNSSVLYCFQFLALWL
jgi:hypothetical protein